MPGPRNKQKPKANTKTKANVNDSQAPSTRAQSSPAQCLTLDEDEMTRCGQPATEGHPKPERCKVHHGQYRILCKKYKDAQQVVDNVKRGAELPTQGQINRYNDWHAALEKARWVRKYLEAIRLEKRGREIHQRRFFLKVDDGHRRRFKLLEREMIRAIDVLDALQRRAYELYESGALQATEHQASSAAEVDLEKKSKLTAEEIMGRSDNPDAFLDSILQFPRKKVLPMLTTSEVGDEDLIDLSLRRQKEQMIECVKHLFDLESFTPSVMIPMGDRPVPEAGPEKDFYISRTEKAFFIYQQFARRIIFHEPMLYMKSLDSVSFKDLILSDEFSMEDLGRFVHLFVRPWEFPLKWFKDAVLDALAISRHGTAANVGRVGNRFPILGGWVFNRAHTKSVPNEGWSLLLGILQPPVNVESRLVRLCNDFDDILGFLSFEAFGYIPPPKFCVTPGHPDFDDPVLSRNHLSLAGVIVTDIVAADTIIHGSVPTRLRARKRGCVVWAEAESRTYMFGAVRHERDGFVEAFLQELRARPDLFQVVLRSETAPGRQVEMFGSGPLNDEALPVVYIRQFEAPRSPSPPSVPPSANDKFTILWSARDVLYGTTIDRKGYLINLEQTPKGWFFRYKTFPVTYFVIIDTIPNRPKWVLTRNVAWAALRAGGYAQGEYTLRKYAAASDKLFEQRMQERLGTFMHSEGFQMMSMEDQVHRDPD